jgi:hypothetical protein
MNYTYKDMLERAKANGISSEKIMWQSIDSLSDMLCLMKKEHPDKYWAFMREQHGVMYNNHYSEDFAKWDVEQMMYTNREGKEMHGGYWTVEQIEQATASMKFPADTNRWDKYVAFNAAYADFCKHFEAGDILKIGFSFFFADEDWGSTTKIWEYMRLKNSRI